MSGSAYFHQMLYILLYYIVYKYIYFIIKKCRISNFLDVDGRFKPWVKINATIEGGPVDAIASSQPKKTWSSF